MVLNILIVPDKFKGTLTAREAADAIATGWRKVRASDRITRLPMSDGGDGFGQVMGSLLKATKRRVQSVDAARERCAGIWYWEPKSKTAIIESAAVIGLAQLPKGKFHPFELDTFGLGEVICAAAKAGARTCLIGIGGSATNDGGFGMARALGWKFLTQDQREIEQWTGLGALHEIVPPQKSRWFKRVIVAVDVQNPLLGPKGCSRIYGPQKGLRPEDYPLADLCLGNLAKKYRALQKSGSRDFAKTAGAGAAGGLGFGLMAFLGAEPKPGFELFADYAGLEKLIKNSDLVITGEGSMDKSTMMGKGVGEVGRMCRKRKVPCIGLAGRLADREKLTGRFRSVAGLTPDLTTPEDAMANSAQRLTELATRTALNWNS